VRYFDHHGRHVDPADATDETLVTINGLTTTVKVARGANLIGSRNESNAKALTGEDKGAGKVAPQAGEQGNDSPSAYEHVRSIVTEELPSRPSATRSCAPRPSA
jgi:hypothetical protein